MRRFSHLLAACVLLVGACDPIPLRSSLQLLPAPIPGSATDSAQAATEDRHAAGLNALDRLAVEFGFRPRTPDPNGDCVRSWRREAPGWTRFGILSVCAVPRPTGSLEVRIVELNVRQWSRHAERFRGALADTLARYGPIDTVWTP